MLIIKTELHLLPLAELGINHSNDKENKDRYDRHCYNPICSHPNQAKHQHIPHHSRTTFIGGQKGESIPTRHPPQRLHTPIHIALALKNRQARMLDLLSLQLQIRQGPASNLLRLVRHPLALAQALGAAIQAVGAREELLPLLQLLVCAGVVGVAVSEQGFAVRGEVFEFALAGVDVGFEVAEALVHF